jgi:hypothetical protein
MTTVVALFGVFHKYFINIGLYPQYVIRHNSIKNEEWQIFVNEKPEFFHHSKILKCKHHNKMH